MTVEISPINLALFAIGGATLLLLGLYYVRECRRIQRLIELQGMLQLTGALLDRLTHHVHILEMNGESFRLKESRQTNQHQPTE